MQAKNEAVLKEQRQNRLATPRKSLIKRDYRPVKTNENFFVTFSEGRGKGLQKNIFKKNCGTEIVGLYLKHETRNSKIKPKSSRQAIRCRPIGHCTTNLRAMQRAKNGD
jgi:hypothetical protein